MMYVATPNGTLRKYNPTNSSVTTVSKMIPSDANDPKRVNFIMVSPKHKKINELMCYYNLYLLLSNKSRKK